VVLQVLRAHKDQLAHKVPRAHSVVLQVLLVLLDLRDRLVQLVLRVLRDRLAFRVQLVKEALQVSPVFKVPPVQLVPPVGME
jgi:hypothetical protein